MTPIAASLVRYLVAAMTFWSPLREHAPEPPGVVLERYTAIATDIAEVCLDPKEPPLFLAPDGRMQTGVLLASLAFHEGRFFKFVDDGTCNERGYKADRRGTCDNGRAYSIWQIQPGKPGLILFGDSWSWWNSRTAESRITGEDLIRDRRLAARVSLHMARQSFRAGSLCVYTGEPCKGGHPNANVRLQTAAEWTRGHPFTEDFGIPTFLAKAMSAG
jgi:hypothetical protein